MRLPLQQQVVFEKAFSTTTLPFLADHYVYDEVVVPGACHLALALCAAELLGQSSCVLQDVVFPQALTLPADGMRTVQCVTTAPAADEAIPATAFRILSFVESDPTSTPLTHATGRFLPTTSVAPAVDLAALQARCGAPLAVDKFYAALAEAHVAVGPRFRWLRTIGRNDGQGEALARIQQPAALATQGYILFPALIDALFQLVAAAMFDQTRTTGQLATLLPFALETFTFYAAPPSQASLWCHVVQGTDQRWMITLFTETGQRLVTVDGFSLRHAPPTTIQGRRLRTDWLYKTQWVPQPLPLAASSAQPARWVVFGAPKVDNAFGATLASTLAADGAPTVLVTSGPAYGRVQLNGDAPLLHATVDPTAPAAFRQLLADLPIAVAGQAQPVGIVYLWGMAETQHTLAAFSGNRHESVPERTAQSAAALLYLVQALLEHEIAATLFVMTSHSQCFDADPDRGTGLPPDPDQMGERAVGGALWALMRTITLEYPRLRFHCIDLHNSDCHNGVDTQTMALLQRELCTGLVQDSNETELLYRNQTRYVARLVRWQPRTAPSTAVTPVMADTNSYLITGGLGALGLQVAEHLVATGARYLILTSRRGLTADLPGAALVQERLRTLQAKGAVIHVEAADVSQPADVARLLAACQALAPLRGIVHTAGVLADALVQQQSLAHLAQVMAPKVQGTWLLHTMTHDLLLDFFVGFSSVAALLGSPGQSNYAAANGFMDALLQQRAAAGLPGLTINWGPWSDVGMAAALVQQQPLAPRRDGFRPMAPDQAAPLVSYLIEQKVSQVGVFDLDQQTLGQHQSFAMPRFAELRATDGAAATPAVAVIDWYEQLLGLAPAARTEHLFHHLRLQVARALGIATPEQVGAHQPLFALGLDSLMALELKNKLEAALKVPLRSTLFFDHPTLARTTNYLIAQLFPAAADDNSEKGHDVVPVANDTVVGALSGQVAHLAQLSDEEAEALLLETLKNL